MNKKKKTVTKGFKRNECVIVKSLDKAYSTCIRTSRVTSQTLCMAKRVNPRSCLCVNCYWKMVNSCCAVQLVVPLEIQSKLEKAGISFYSKEAKAFVVAQCHKTIEFEPKPHTVAAILLEVSPPSSTESAHS